MPFGPELLGWIEGGFAVAHPLRLLLGSILVVLLGLVSARRGPLRIEVPAAPLPTGATSRSWLRSIDGVWLASSSLRLAAVGLLALAAADPSALLPERPAAGTGVDLVVALDASGSMDALDGQLEGRRVSRLELAKRAVADLIRQREGDRIGLIVFGERAFTQCPLTLDHSILQAALERVRVGVAGDSTAIGDAVALAVRRLRSEGGRADAERVLVVLTDGRHNAGQIPPETAARIASREGVRTHAVGIGTTGLVPFASGGPDEPLRFERVDLDRATLERMAQSTGGRFFAARQPEDVVEVAEAIHRLEARPVEEEPRFRRASLAPLALLLALLALVMDALVEFGVARRAP